MWYKLKMLVQNWYQIWINKFDEKNVLMEVWRSPLLEIVPQFQPFPLC